MRTVVHPESRRPHHRPHRAVVIPPDVARYKRVSDKIRTILSDLTPMIEPVSLDEAYVDLGDDVRLQPLPPAELLAEVGLAIEREIGITVSIGLAGNKFLAKLASDLDKPRGFAVIGRKEAKAFLAPLPVRKIMGVGPAMAAKLEVMDIATIGRLQALSPAGLVGRFGKFGRRLAQSAHGEDDRAVTPSRPVKSISAETTFRSDLRRANDLAAALRPQCERVAVRLVRARLAGGTVVLKLKTADYRIITRHAQLSDPTQRAEVIFRSAVPLIRKEAAPSG